MTDLSPALLVEMSQVILNGEIDTADEHIADMSRAVIDACRSLDATDDEIRETAAYIWGRFSALADQDAFDAYIAEMGVA